MPDAPASPFPRWPLAALATSFFVLGVSVLSVIALAAPITADLEIESQQIAYLITLFALTYAVAAPSVQIVFRRVPLKRLILAGLVLIALGAAIGASAPGFWLLAVSRLIMGFGASMVGPISLAIGSGMVAPGQQGRGLAAVFSGMTLSSVAGMPLSAWLGAEVGWREATLLLGGLALLAALAIWRLVPQQEARDGPTAAQLFAILRQPRIMSAVLVTFLQMASQFATYALVGPFLAAEFDTAIALLPLALLIFGVGGNAVGGWLADRFRADRVCLAVLSASCLFFLLMAVAPADQTLGLLLVGCWAVLGLMFQAPQQRRLIGLAPARAGLILALHASSLYVGMSFGSSLSGWVAAHSGFGALPLASLLLAGLGVLATAYASRRA